MKFTCYKRLFVLCVCAVFCFAAAARVRAQGERQPPLLTLRAGNRGLRVFDDGTVIEHRREKGTLRRLSERRMRRLREVIARHPCVKEWQRPDSPPTIPGPEELKQLTIVGKLELSTAYNNDCWGGVLGFGLGLDEIWVTIRAPAVRVRSFAVYVVCDGAKESYKKSARSNYQRVLKPNWHRFLADVSKAAGAKNILKGCDAWKD